jgi:hypothetical protein
MRSRTSAWLRVWMTCACRTFRTPSSRPSGSSSMRPPQSALPSPLQLHRVCPVGLRRLHLRLCPGCHLSSRVALAAGTALGPDTFVEADARSWAETVAVRVATFASLPLGRQDNFLLLHPSLKLCLTHLTKKPCGHGSPPCRRRGTAGARRHHRPGRAPSFRCHAVPPGGFPARPSPVLRGSRLTNPLKGDAAFLASNVALRRPPPGSSTPRAFPALPCDCGRRSTICAQPLVPGAQSARRAPLAPVLLNA